MSIFDKFTDLDQALAYHRIEAAHGSAIFNNMSYLDSQRALNEIEAALGIDLDDRAGLLDFRSIEAAIDAAVEGSSSPDWVPANAKIHIDLIAPGRAWTEDNGEVAIDTLLGTDANTSNAWDDTAYDASNLTADGYACSTASGQLPVALIGGARTKLLAGATATLRTKQVGLSPDTVNLALVSQDGSAAAYATLYNYNASISTYSDATASIPSIMNIADGAINVAAVTFDGTRVDLCCNSSDAVSVVLGVDDAPPGSPFVAALIATGAEYLQSITIYDALPDTAGLSELSATGVTNNTAPTAITISVYSSETTLPTWAVGQIAAYFPNLFEVAQANAIHVADPEGNPTTITMVDDGSGRFVINTTDQPGTIQMASSPAPDPGDYHFTLRATDPGGLYVERQFTITVTA